VETAVSSSKNNPEETKTEHRHRKVGLLVAAVGLAVEALTLLSRGYGIGGNVIVRCREGHLFTTIWIPGASVKSLRLGWTRFQHCPVGRHWSLVTPIPVSELTEDERRAADQRHDVRVP
jgi:hypothetical protein